MLLDVMAHKGTLADSLIFQSVRFVSNNEVSCCLVSLGFAFVYHVVSKVLRSQSTQCFCALSSGVSSMKESTKTGQEVVVRFLGPCS